MKLNRYGLVVLALVAALAASVAALSSGPGRVPARQEPSAPILRQP